MVCIFAYKRASLLDDHDCTWRVPTLSSAVRIEEVKRTTAVERGTAPLYRWDVAVNGTSNTVKTMVVIFPLAGAGCFFFFFSETESLRSLLGGREAEAVALRDQARKEREELVSRLLTDKGR